MGQTAIFPLAGKPDRHLASRCNHNVFRILRNRDQRGYQSPPITRHQHQIAFRVHFERTVSRIERRAAVIHLKEAVADNRQVEFARRTDEAAGTVVSIRARDASSQSDMNAGGRELILRIGGTRQFHVLVIQVLEVRARSLEAVGAGVRQVVRDRVQIEEMGLHAGCGRVQCSNSHNVSPFFQVASKQLFSREPQAYACWQRVSVQRVVSLPHHRIADCNNCPNISSCIFIMFTFVSTTRDASIKSISSSMGFTPDASTNPCRRVDVSTADCSDP